MDSTASSPVALRDAPRDDPGLVGQAVLRLLTHETRVDAVHALSPRFRLVSLRSEAFRRIAHVPGDKVQVRVGGMAFRTFTPFRLAEGDDSLALLGYLHGSAPAARWLAGVAPGDRCHVLGPRRSMTLESIDRSTVFVGDETSLGLALARYAGADSFRQYELSGQAATIQRLQRGLKAAGAKPSQMLVKAYWAPGKIALD